MDRFGTLAGRFLKSEINRLDVAPVDVAKTKMLGGCIG
jgi:hypothetical protein